MAVLPTRFFSRFRFARQHLGQVAFVDDLGPIEWAGIDRFDELQSLEHGVHGFIIEIAGAPVDATRAKNILESGFGLGLRDLVFPGHDLRGLFRMLLDEYNRLAPRLDEPADQLRILLEELGLDHAYRLHDARRP